MSFSLVNTNMITGRLSLDNVAQASAASLLLGRGSESGAGSLQEISLGNGLEMNGSTLTAAGGSITNSATPPVSPSNGDLWFNTENGILYVYYTDDDGSQWVAPDNGGGGSSGSMILLASATASNNAEILFDNVFNPSLYSEYVLKFQGVQPASDNVGLRVQLRNSTPSNITDFHRNNRLVGQIDVSSAVIGGGGNLGGTTGWEMFPAAGNAANELSSITVQIQPISGQWTYMNSIGYIATNLGNKFSLQNAGACEGITAPAGVRIYMSSGNISIGTFQLYGIKK